MDTPEERLDFCEECDTPAYKGQLERRERGGPVQRVCGRCLLYGRFLARKFRGATPVAEAWNITLDQLLFMAWEAGVEWAGLPGDDDEDESEDAGRQGVETDPTG